MGPFMVLITVQSRESPRSTVCPLPQAIHLCLKFLYGSALWAKAVFNNKKCHEELTDVGILSQKSVKEYMHFLEVEVAVFQLFFKCVDRDGKIEYFEYSLYDNKRCMQAKFYTALL